MSSVVAEDSSERREAAAQTTLSPTSLIVCSRNRPDLLADCVDSIFAGDSLPVELIVVDQSDAPHPILQRAAGPLGCHLRYIWTRTKGLSRASNIGVAATRHPVLVFTHDDVRVTPSWFGAIVRALGQAGPGALVTGRVLPSADTSGGFVPTLKTDELPAEYVGRVGEDVLYPLNMAMHRTAFDDLGPFDERLGPGTPFPAAEDNDFGLRALEAGYRIRYVPEATLYHRGWRSKDDYLSVRWAYGRGQGAYYAKYLSLRDRYMLRRMRWDVIRHILQFFRRIRNQRTLAYGDMVYAAALISGMAEWLVTYRRTR